MAVNKIRFENQRAYPTAFNPTSVGGHIKLNIKQGKFYLKSKLINKPMKALLELQNVIWSRLKFRKN